MSEISHYGFPGRSKRVPFPTTIIPCALTLPSESDGGEQTGVKALEACLLKPHFVKVLDPWSFA
ncbi:predicted protein [Botrytis cinerea T4]|uniref:Uncharacterized protein n=1 Tax=Botryotinia fuckeliana (strain T4) TaxID=999810 RepID=G2Y9K7_BOTF4|nr:predicted protein [Botrytis cinerea T4]